MKLLLTNDDGYLAPGFQALWDTLKTSHKVFVAAPMTQKSGSGHSISLFQPIEYKKLDSQSYAVDGTPADCIKAAFFGLFPDIRFDLIVSGINNGPNMGNDIFYSGTVAAAREAALNGISALSCSADGYDNSQDFNSAALYLSRFIPLLTKDFLSKSLILNINFPVRPPYRGSRITHLGKRIYSDQILFSNTTPLTLTITGDKPTHLSEDGSDLSCVHNHFVSITPLSNETNIPTINPLLISLETSGIHQMEA